MVDFQALDIAAKLRVKSSKFGRTFFDARGFPAHPDGRVDISLRRQHSFSDAANYHFGAKRVPVLVAEKIASIDRFRGMVGYIGKSVRAHRAMVPL